MWLRRRGLGRRPSSQSLYLDVFWTRALSAWPLPEAQSPGPVSWHVSLPPPAKEECTCPWGKWKHLVLARPVHISAGPHELAGDACSEENRRPRRWPTSFLPHRPRRPQPRNTDEYVLGSENTRWKWQRLTSIQAKSRLRLCRFAPGDPFHPPPVIARRCSGSVLLPVMCKVSKIPSLAIVEVRSAAPRCWSSSFLFCNFQK